MPRVSENIRRLADDCENELRPVFARFERTARHNTEKVLRAFSELRLAERHFAPTNGYGYDDDGRILCDSAFAKVFGCESGFARHSIVSGTHALGLGLFALLRPGDTLLSVSGPPYDTLHGVVGIDGDEKAGCLAEFGVRYRQIELLDKKALDIAKTVEALKADKSVKVVYVQRSRGYRDRESLSAAAITELYGAIRAVSDAFLVVDNCYGEFCETEEPRADLLIGSLIKNPGGGIAETGGYLVGSERAVSLAAARLTVPGIELECGASLGQTRPMLKGLFFAPHTVCQALKTAAFGACLFRKLGYETDPAPDGERRDIVQAVRLGSEKLLRVFCAGIQSGSPVDSFAAPEPWAMPGYADEVIMAAGAFTQGSSLELSADAPLREPYTVFLQGGLTYESGRFGVMCAAQACEDAKLRQ